MSCYPNNSCNRNVLKSCSNTDVVVYTGENLTCTGVEYGDSLTVVLQKLDEKYCEILDIIENCNTTTTTSSSTTKNPSSGCDSPLVDLFANNPKEICLSVNAEAGFNQVNINPTGILNNKPHYTNIELDPYSIEILWSSVNNRWELYLTSLEFTGLYAVLNVSTYLPVGAWECLSSVEDCLKIGEFVTSDFSCIPPPPPNLIRLTPANIESFFGVIIQRVSGVNPDNLTFAMQLDRFASLGCTGGSFSYSFSPTLDAGDSSKFADVTSQNSNLSAKVVTLTVNSISITTSPQTITVNGTDYIIEGFNACTVL